ncbi:MAG: hypothetical protein IJP86_01815 [Synergistaceae bacterium]|nr:hypothetical protein [Synergistaceae bacterium]
MPSENFAAIIAHALPHDIIPPEIRAKKGLDKLQNRAIIDQTRPDHDHPIANFRLSARDFLIRIGVLRLRTKLRLYLWKAEDFLHRIFPRKKKTLILTKDASNGGLFAVFRYFLGGIAYADRKGMTPVIDMKNTLNAYLYEHEVGRVNSWEYYFEQPGGILLEEAANYGECITLKVGKFPVPRQDSALFRNQDGQLDYCEYVDFNYDSDRMLAEYSTGRANDKYLRGLEYLVSILFLSRCRGFIASMTSGSTGVMCLSEGFEYLYVFDLGLYP